MVSRCIQFIAPMAWPLGHCDFEDRDLYEYSGLERTQMNLWRLPLRFQADREMVIAAVMRNGWALEYASAELQADKEVVLAAVTKNAGALMYASAELKADKEIVLAAVANDWLSLEFASAQLQVDREVLLAAVGQNGAALQVAPKSLQDDKEVALAAVAQNGYALQWASTALKADKEVVLAAVTNFGEALQEATPELQANEEVALAAVAQTRRALDYVAMDRKEIIALVQRLRVTYFTFIVFLLAARPSNAIYLEPVARPALWKLDGLGEDAGRHVRQLIAGFMGVPCAGVWATTRAAARNLDIAPHLGPPCARREVHRWSRTGPNARAENAS